MDSTTTWKLKSSLKNLGEVLYNYPDFVDIMKKHGCYKPENSNSIFEIYSINELYKMHMPEYSNIIDEKEIVGFTPPNFTPPPRKFNDPSEITNSIISYLYCGIYVISKLGKKPKYNFTLSRKEMTSYLYLHIMESIQMFAEINGRNYSPKTAYKFLLDNYKSWITLFLTDRVFYKPNKKHQFIHLHPNFAILPERNRLNPYYNYNYD